MTPLDTRSLLIIGPPPTPNGDLHIGHIAGPYMSADVMRRWYRLDRRRALFVTGTDDSQTFVVGSARKHGVTPDVLAARSTAAIRRSLALSMIDVDGFAPFDDGYERTVRAFLDPLQAAGKFRRVTRNLPYDERHGHFLVEGLIAGECPRCLAPSRGALCESCGLPFHCEDLRRPTSVLDPGSTVTRRAVDILAFPLESVRPQLQAYYSDARLTQLRPASARIVRQLLAEMLPEFPITYPLDWGIQAQYDEVPGQVFNAWAEGMAASMYCTAAAGSAEPEEGMAAWTRSDVDLVYFLGVDNVYFWGMSHLALLMAHDGRYMLPRTYYSNHFYELEDEKISTSRGHVLSMAQLLECFSAEAVRFYLCWTAPETTERSFSAEALRTIVSQHLIQPWNLVRSVALADVAATTQMAPSPDSLDAEKRMEAEVAACLSIETFSVAALARCVAKHLHRLSGYVRRSDVPVQDIRSQFLLLARLADPILKQTSDATAILDLAWRPAELHLESSRAIDGACASLVAETVP